MALLPNVAMPKLREVHGTDRCQAQRHRAPHAPATFASTNAVSVACLAFVGAAGGSRRARFILRAAGKPEDDGELAGGSFEIMKTSGVEWTMMFKAADDFARKNGLRKLGDSKTAAAKLATFYPPDEAFRGVRDWLDARDMRRHYAAVNKWCKEMGAEDIRDLIENTEDIAEYLGDALNEKERAALFGRRFSEGRSV
mmetsp:Transcript_51133/g.95801  ORF Transcript_51133/g.95801 Transcript_51133/m.95801 type:complete len:197 (+) Transcript_51133:58-648(+)